MVTTTTPSDYERTQAEEIEAWYAEQPGWGTRLLARPGQQAALAAQRLIPVDVLRRALRGIERTAGRVSGRRDVLRAAGVDTLDDLTALPMEACDALATRVARRGLLLGGAGGAVFGAAGAVGLVADVPSLLTLALRTIHRTAYCYGEDWLQTPYRALPIGVFALASANSLEEKQAAWAALRDGTELLDSAWRDGVERVAERELAKEATQFSLQTLASRMSTHLGTRKAAGMAPVLGAVIGGAVNASYIGEIGKVARYVLQDRWLRKRYPSASPVKTIRKVAKVSSRKRKGAEAGEPVRSR